MELPIHLKSIIPATRHHGQFVSYDTNLKVVGEYDDTTLKLFTVLVACYNYYRERLFGRCLPPVFVVLNRNVRCMGYYRPYSWRDKPQHNFFAEINIHPAVLQLKPVEIFQTLVHEACHHFQFSYANPGRARYHNIEFSRIMFSVGLMCSSTGKPGGKVTGERMADYVIPGGMFDMAFQQMPTDLIIPFEGAGESMATHVDTNSTQKSERKLKTKFTCPCGEQNVWGKPSTDVTCNKCKEILSAIPNNKL